MSHHQSRADRSDSQQQRRGARSGGGAAHQRNSVGKGSGGGQGPSASGVASSLSSPTQPAPVPSSKRSGGINGQTRGHLSTNLEVSESQRAQQRTLPQQHAMQVGHGHSGIKSTNGTLPRSSKPGTSSDSSILIDAAPVNPKPDTSWNTSVHPQLSFQFGSIGASIGPGPGPYVQIPARTSSAPPNLDEQKQDLLRFEAIGAQPLKVPIPSGGQQQAQRPQVPQSGAQQPRVPSFMPQPQQSSAAIAQPSHDEQSQQLRVPIQVTQRSSHPQGSSAGTSQGQLQMQAHVIPSLSQQSMIHMPYQHGLQQHMQHNGAQVMKYPSMGGPSTPLMGPPTLAPLSGAMQATQMSQLSQQLPGGLGSGIPGPPYGVAPVPGSFIPTRTSIAVKITHPETHEELKFDYKSTKRDSLHDGGFSVKTAAPQGSMVANGLPQTRPSLGYGSGVHLSNQNVYAAAQHNGLYNPMQHYHQPPPPSVVSSKNVIVPETSSTSKLPPVSLMNTMISRELAPGIIISSEPDPSYSVSHAAATVATEKQELLPVLSDLGTVDQDHESTVDINDKSVKVWPAESAALAGKDAVLLGKEGKEEFSDLKDSHRADLTTEVKLNNKKKKKKDGPSRASSGDNSKVSKAVDNRKLCDSKDFDAQRTKQVIPEGECQLETSLTCTSEMSAMIPEAIAMTTAAEPSPICSEELVTVNHCAIADVSLDSERKTERGKEDGTVEESLPTESCLEIEAFANSVDIALAANVDLGSDKCMETHSEKSSVQLDGQTSANKYEAAQIDPGSNLSHSTQPLESPIELESQASLVEEMEKPDQGPCIVREVDTCAVREGEIHQDDGVTPEVILESESLYSSEVGEEVGDLKAQHGSAEVHSKGLLVSTKDVSDDAIVSAARDVKQGSKKKKLKDILAKADAAGTGDLYNAYKAPEQQKMDEAVHTKAGATKSSTNDVVKQVATSDEKAAPKEADDWEDAVELPSLNVVDWESGDGGKIREKEAPDAKVGETYTRDFLLTFKDQNLDLPLDFEVRADIVELLVNPGAVSARYVDHDMPSGRLDRQLSGGPRRTNSSNISDDEKWARMSQSTHSQIWPDGYTDSGLAAGFRPGNAQGLIPRMAPNNRPGITGPSIVSGLIPGKAMTTGAGSGLFRTNTADSDRWQRMPTGGQKGLIPSPQTPLPPVHKAERRYEIGTISDEEEVKQRQIKGILNKLTPQNFQKLFEQVKDVNIQSATTLTGVISQIFDKALMEPTFCEMYATFCKGLATDMPEFIENGDKITFKRVLLNKCQEEFHGGECEQAEASVVQEGNEDVSAEEREGKRLKAKRRMLGNIRFIGELYKKHMLTERIMHECICKLLGDYGNPEEEDVEALCKLMSTIGYVIDQPMRKEHIDAYLERIARLSNNQKLSARIRFMLKDLIDLRKNGWQERRKVDGPKRIEEVHRDAVQERQATAAQVGRLSRGSNMGGSSGRRLAPPDLSARGPPSPMFAPTTPMGLASSARGPTTQGRAPLVQDVRLEGKLLIERSMPMPLSQRSADEGPLTLGPQGGLGRGFSLRSQFSGPAVPLTASGEIRRLGPASMAAYSSSGPLGSERPVTPPERSLLDRSATASGNSSKSFRNLERTLSDKTPAAGNLHLQQQGQGSRPSTAPAYMPLTEEQLTKKSEAALLEYFSARDLKEAAQCVEDLRAPNFYPTMVSNWIALSFEKKDPERELLAKLLISLQKSAASIVKQEQILQGLQFALDLLEDSVMDTPMAPDYTAKLLVRLISAPALTLDQVADLLKKSDVLQSQFGLEILGKVLAGLCQDRGERLLVDMFQSSGVRLEDFIAAKKYGSNSVHDFLGKYNLQFLRPEPGDRLVPNNVELVGAQLLEHFRTNEPIAETQRWLEKSADLATQSESSFLQMLMTQVLRHLIPAKSCEKDYRAEILKEKLGHYRTLLRKFATDKEKQWQYITAMQLYVHSIDHPAGLMTALFSTLYHEEVISESAFYKWQDDINDPTAGRDRALRDVYRWLQWLRTEPEQSQDDEF